MLSFYAANLSCKWAEFWRQCHFLILNPGGFLSANYDVKKKENSKLKILSIMSFPVPSHTAVVATMESENLGKDRDRYTNNSKGMKMFEKLIHKQAPDVSPKQTNMPRVHRDSDITQRALFLWWCMAHGWALYQRWSSFYWIHTVCFKLNPTDVGGGVEYRVCENIHQMVECRPGVRNKKYVQYRLTLTSSTCVFDLLTLYECVWTEWEFWLDWMFAPILGISTGHQGSAGMCSNRPVFQP